MCLTIMGGVCDIGKSPTLKCTPQDLKIDVCSSQDDDFIMSEKGLLKSMSGAKPISPPTFMGWSSAPLACLDPSLKRCAMIVFRCLQVVQGHFLSTQPHIKMIVPLCQKIRPTQGLLNAHS